MNPLQALFNSLVYRRWNFGSERVYLPWRSLFKRTSNIEQQSSETSVSAQSQEENFPLLQNVPRIGINGYTTYR